MACFFAIMRLLAKLSVKLLSRRVSSKTKFEQIVQWFEDY